MRQHAESPSHRMAIVNVLSCRLQFVSSDLKLGKITSSANRSQPWSWPS